MPDYTRMYDEYWSRPDRQILGDEAIEADHLQITVAHQKIPPAVLGR